MSTTRIVGVLAVVFVRACLAASSTKPTGVGPNFAGLVVDKETRKPIAGATITLHRQYGRNLERQFDDETMVSDGRGEFHFVITARQSAEASLYLEFEVAHASYARIQHVGDPLRKALSDLAEGRKPFFAELEVCLADEATGTIEDPDGKPLVNCPIDYVSAKDRGAPSWDETTTDAAGRFHLKLIKGATLARFSAEPSDDANLVQEVGSRRGELGRHWVQKGCRLVGSILDEKGSPLAGVKLKLWPKVDGKDTGRSTTSDAQGRFAFAPLPSGSYTFYADSGRFADLPVELPASQAMQTVEFRASPQVRVRAKFVDTDGKPVSDLDLCIGGRENWRHYYSRIKPGKDGIAVGSAPRGIIDARVYVQEQDSEVVLWRRGNETEKHAEPIRLGTLDGDVTDLVIIRAQAPKVVVRAVGADGQPVANFRPGIQYSDPLLHQPPARRQMENGDVMWVKGDHGRQETIHLVPEKQMTLAVLADGYQPFSENLQLAEGQVKEMEVKLKPAVGK